MDIYRVKIFSIPNQEIMFVASQRVTGKGMKKETSKVLQYYFTLLQLVLTTLKEADIGLVVSSHV